MTITPFHSKTKHKDTPMPVDASAMCRSFLPNNPRLAEIILATCKEVYHVRFLPKNLIRTLVNRAMEEIRRGGHEMMKDPTFKTRMEEHARSLHSRFKYDIGHLNNKGVKSKV
jgi:hypothetical protein